MGKKPCMYRVQMQLLRKRRWGLLGRQLQNIPLPREIIIQEGQSTELFDAERTKVGIATINMGVLEVTPEGDVLIDSGDIKDFKALVEITGKESEKQKEWIGSFKTRGNLTLKSSDGNKRVNLIRIS